jgi:hypothetical protein
LREKEGRGENESKRKKTERLLGVKEESGHLLAMDASAFDSICR